jgi:secernin
MRCKPLAITFVFVAAMALGSSNSLTPNSYACDTMVALPDATVTGTTILGKNSDRPIWDCQPIFLHPAREGGGTLQLEYRSIPDTGSIATVGSSPYWCWGYEEGQNEFGVTIGNEAIFTKTFAEAVKSPPAEEGLLGMDILRLALERGKTAHEAMRVITDMTSKYGQWGSGVPCFEHAAGGYDNSYIVADAKEAYIVETCGNRWAVKRVTKGVYTISNEPTIRCMWFDMSPDLIDYAIKQGWWPEELRDSFDFAYALNNPGAARHLSHPRIMRSTQLLKEKQGEICPRYMMRVLRDHYDTTFLKGPKYNAADPDFQTLCMHVSPPNFTWGNTASSCVGIIYDVEKDKRLPEFWWTPVSPCNGAYVPFFAQGSKIPQICSTAGTAGKTVTPPPQAKQDSFSANSYWWLFRELMDKTKGDAVMSYPGYYSVRNPIVRAVFDDLEKKFAARCWKVNQHAAKLYLAGNKAAAATLLDKFTADCVNKVIDRMARIKKAFEVIGDPAKPEWSKYSVLDDTGFPK